MTGTLWSQLRSIIYASSGIRLQDSLERTCLRILEEEIRTSGDRDSGALLDRVVRAGHEPARDRLVEKMLIGTTWFFREPATLTRMVNTLKKRNITEASVWCAGVSTGQEAYSVAITLLEAGIEPRVLGTDVNRNSLAVSKAGHYSSCNGSGLPREWLNRWYTTKPDGSIVISQSVRKCVTFVRHNLIRDVAPPYPYQGFHVVLCRNVLMYFEPSDSRAIVAKLRSALLPGGELLLGAVEVPVLDRSPSTRTPPSGEDPQPTPLQTASPSAPAPKLLPSMSEIEQLVQSGDLGRAITLADERAIAMPLDAQLHTALGTIHRLAGNISKAATSFRAASFLDPMVWYPVYQLGCTLESQKDAHAARSAYQRALAIIDNDGSAGSPFSADELDVLRHTVRATCLKKIAHLS